MLSIVIPFLFFIGICLTNSILFRQKFEQLLPVCFMECTVILYVSGFFNLKLGIWICILLAFLSIPLLINSKNNKKYSFKDSFFTDFFWVFLILYLFVFVLNIGKTFSRWDEFSHWGVMAKEMFRLNKYYYVDEAQLICHKDYPPFTTLLEYLWCHLCGEFKDCHAYNAKIIFSLSLFFPIIAQLQTFFSQKQKLLSRFCSILLISSFFIILSLSHSMGEASFYRTIYTETVLAALFLYGLYIFIFEKNDFMFSYFRNTLFLTSLLLVKQIAIYFFAILFFIYITKEFLEFGKNIYQNKKRLFCNLIMFGVPIILWKVWNTVVTTLAPTGQFSVSKFSLANIQTFINGNAQDYQYETLQRYVSALFKRSVIEKPISVSYIAIILILFGIIMLLGKLEKKMERRPLIYLLGIGLFFCSVSFIAVMGVTYLYGFTVQESLALACYSRYMSSIIYPFIISTILLFMYTLSQYTNLKNNCLFFISIIGITLILIPFSRLKYEMLPGIFCDNPAEIYQADAQRINENTPESAQILLVCQGDNGSGRNMLAYQVLPRRVSEELSSFGSPYYDGDIYTKDLSVEEFKELLKDYEYVFFSTIDDQFIERYQVVFGEFPLTNNLLFQIIQSDTIELKLENIPY